MEQQIYLCGIQPTNQSQLTIGNYLGVILPLVQLQEQNKAIQIYLLIADLHAFTIPYTKIQQNNIKKFIQVLIACGVDPHKTTIILQSTLPEHTQLCYLLMCYTSVGELFRMTQYKDKKQKLLKHHDQKSLVPAGLLFYPCLMAADILLYQTDFVLVGADQKQHIELARDIACRINHH